ncbi:MAG: hypothetical protein A2Y10_18390 [Planctomycetes bacterium GWF2_41_51]|nr:MAG: hypothetical protein A2Y10_18390 [Planctomycetes bacterium GWF2_41_51]HBG26662.1 hypothetical protein [Phycisphaerales bacterium]
MKKIVIFVGIVLISNLCSADVIRGISIDFVNIYHAGNVADIDGTPGWGAVGYNYRIGKYEITNDQWNNFITAVGVPTGNTHGAYDGSPYFTGSQQPVNNISWYEAIQFCNYLTSGDKSKGAYQFSGNNTNPGNFQGINRETAQQTYGKVYVLPTINEWYKAAYYKSDGSSYTLYANGTNTIPSTSEACYSIYSSPWNVGMGLQEQNGTFDMMGNVWEWNETAYPVRGVVYICGGAWSGSGSAGLAASNQRYNNDTYEGMFTGFRIAVIPEPTTLCLFGLGLIALRRKK